MQNHSNICKRLILSPLGILVFISAFYACEEGGKSEITEEKQTIKTYPFNDPNPIPALASGRSRLYPYFQFNQYSIDSIDQEWTVITLENDHIEVTVLPEVGGKIWGAVEKSTGLEFLYKNKVKKFRNIGLRGPWTSGGIEFNFGTAGHTPATATPVDYLIRENDDGSVTAIVGAMDLPSRSEWRVKINLPADKAYFETESFWYNTSQLKQFNYVWMNAAIKAADDLQFFFPGQYHAGHPGDVHAWHVDEKGRDLSWYRNNDFVGNKSYHIFGEKSEYFGAYWHDEEFGFGNWSLYSDMPGKKLWIWSLARSGGIWEDLLTDNDGQYVEVQSGRYFTQALGRSAETPFNHDTFAPLGTDHWKELWFPVKKIGGIEAASPYAVLNRETDGNRTIIKLMALQYLNDDLNIYLDNDLAHSTRIALQPLEVFYDTLEVPGYTENMQIILGEHKIVFNSNRDLISIDRPVETDPAAGVNTTSRVYHRGLNQLASRNYSEALESFTTVIEHDPAFTKAYVNLADLYFRKGDFRNALEFSRQALSHNTYDAEANYMHGVIHSRLGNTHQAIEAFGWAARSLQYRSAAYALIAELYLRIGRPDMTEEFAARSLEYNLRNINAHKALAIAYRKNELPQKAADVLDALLELDPLNHFARFEHFLLNKNQRKSDEFTSLIRNELPHETFMELALYYASAGLNYEAVEVLNLAPSYPMTDYWMAYLLRDDSPDKSSQYLQLALEASPYLVFPFRVESIPVLEWAEQQAQSWKNLYYQGLIYWYAGREENAASLFDQIEQASDYAPFYIARGELRNRLGYSGDQVYADLKRANELDQGEWRTWHALNGYYFQSGELEMVLTNSETAYKQFSDKDALKMDYARALLVNEKYKTCLDHLDRIQILPFEDAREGREIFEKANMFYAAELIDDGHYQEALVYLDSSRQWPETLGVGKPYDPDLRLQQYLEASIYRYLGEQDKAEELYAEILSYTDAFPSRWGPGHFAAVLTLRDKGNTAEARRLMNSWTDAQPDNQMAGWARAAFDRDTNLSRHLEQQIRHDSPDNTSYSILMINAVSSANRIAG